MASSTLSSSTTLQDKYEVFLSFRGEDTRDNFTSHLYAAFCQKNIQTFIDEDGLKRGDEISPALLKAIEESKISVIIFSKEYASSKWCLDELVKILECKEKNGQMVMPVFYHVNPSDVRKQTGSFKDAFTKHEFFFKKMPEKIQRWRAALIQASNLSGWDSMVIKPESKLVAEIVKEISKKLNDISPSSDCKGLVGIDSRIYRIKSLLCIQLLDFKIVGIWGMGGIGKTTIAGVVFNQISSQFDGRCFITNVREESKKCGLVHLRNQLLSQILEEDHLTLGTPIIPEYINKRLQYRKVFIVLDDVSDREQLEFLIGGIDRLGLGSRVIVTTRDKQVLCNYGIENIYKLEGLEYHEALQLFSGYAFKQKCPSQNFWELSNKVVDYAKGNPLALKVLSSSLYGKSAQHWHGVLHKLKSIANPKIHNVLKISYDGLDREEQDIFLDIACFFKGEDSKRVTEILDSCYLATCVGLSALIDKSLVTIIDNVLDMHDLIQEMGWEIIREESFKELGKRSRLWNHDDVFHVLKNNMGTGAIQGLFLDMSKIPNLHLSSEAFENMPNLKFLKFYVPEQHVEEFLNISKVHLPEGLKYLSNELRYLYWHGYPLKTLPSNFSPINLIELQLPYSNVDVQLWVDNKHGSDVKLDQINHSDGLESEHCQSWVDIPLSTQYLNNLRTLNLRGCESVRTFPSDIHFRTLDTLLLSHCRNLKLFPQISGNIKQLYLTGTAIEEVPSSIECLTELKSLHLWECDRLKSISDSILKLKSLHYLSLSHYRIPKSQLSSLLTRFKEFISLRLAFCNIAEIPEALFCLSSLVHLDLSGNIFESLPTSIKKLFLLGGLSLSYCEKLQSIPELPQALERLDARDCWQLQSIAVSPPNLEGLDEPELEILSERRYSFSGRQMEFIFTNCLNLNQNAGNFLTNSQQRIQHMATVALRFCYEVFDNIPKISFFLPGSEIPGWFSHQSSGSSITIKLPQHRSNRKLIGFAIAAILAFETSNYANHLLVDVNCRCNYGILDVDFWTCFVDYPESDHIVLGYTPCIDLKGDCTTASFEFSVLFDEKKVSPEAGLRLKCCGVHPLYVQPNMNSIEDLGETTIADNDGLTKLHDENTCGSESGIENGTSKEVEVEPNANTYCYLRARCLLLFLIVLFDYWNLLMGMPLKMR